jgi:hypothetical protein
LALLALAIDVDTAIPSGVLLLTGHEGEIAIYAWRGDQADPQHAFGGAGWLRAVEWWPYQRYTFVTPPFGGYTSGHIAFSRASAEVLTLFTGSEFFPGGLGEFVAGGEDVSVWASKRRTSCLAPTRRPRYGFEVNEDLGIAGRRGGGAGNSNNIDMILRTGWTAVVLANYTETSLRVLAPVVNKMRDLVKGEVQ